MANMVIGIIGAAVGIAGVVFGLITALRNKKNDDKAEGKYDGVLATDVGYIKKGIDGIEKRLEKQESNYVGVVARLTEVDASVKQAHKRIDKLEKFHLPN